MAAPAHQYHDSDIRSMRVVPAHRRILPLTDNQRWKLAADMLEAFGHRRGTRPWSNDSEENVQHGLEVARQRAFQYGRFVYRRLAMCADRRRVRVLLKRIRAGVGRNGTELRVYFERGYASEVAKRC